MKRSHRNYSAKCKAGIALGVEVLLQPCLTQCIIKDIDNGKVHPHSLTSLPPAISPPALVLGMSQDQ